MLLKRGISVLLLYSLGGIVQHAQAQFVQQGGKLIGNGMEAWPTNQGVAVAVSADGNTIIELRIKRPTGSAINRLVMVKRRLYVITADWLEGSGLNAERVLDSFELVDGRSLIA